MDPLSPYAAIAKLVVAVILELTLAAVGFYVGHRWEQGNTAALQARFSAYQAQVASAEAATRLSDLNAQTASEKAAQAAVSAANDRARSLEVARAGAAQALHDTIAKEGNTDAPLAMCLARKLPADILRGLAR